MTSWILPKCIKLNPDLWKYIHYYLGILAYANRLIKKHISNKNLTCLYPPKVSRGLLPKSLSTAHRRKINASLPLVTRAVTTRANEGGSPSEERHPRRGVHTHYNGKLSHCPVGSSNHGNLPVTSLTQTAAERL